MKKFSLLFFNAFTNGSNDRVRASKIFFLAFLFSCLSFSGYAQVVITAGNATGLCGPFPGCSPVTNIVITESLTTDIATGTDQIQLVPPTGWQFCTSLGNPVFNYTPLRDITSVTPSGFSFTSLNFTINSSGTTQLDQITISNVFIQPLTPSAAPGFVTAVAATGVNGVVPGTSDFANVSVTPAAITGTFAICYGTTTTLSDSDPGGVWSSDNAAVAIDPTLGIITTLPPASATPITAHIRYTLPGGCYAEVPFVVNPNPTPIAGVHDICKLNQYTISDAVPGGIFSGTIASYINGPLNATADTARVIGVNAGAATVTYTLQGTGCFTISNFNVNALPAPIIDPSGTYQLCAGSFTTLSDATPGGTWTTANPVIATITNPGGVITAGANPGGTTRVIYTLTATTCSVDTAFKVNPVPTAISGPASVCMGSTIQLTDATTGGTWTSSNPSFATVDGTGLVTGVSAGALTITYGFVNSGCYVTYAVNVNLLPDPITGNSNLCLHDSTALNETSTGGTWSITNPVIATVDSLDGVVTGNSPGPDSVLYTFSTGCFASYTVTVNNNPAAITGPTDVCRTQTITLADATITSPAGTWSSANNTVASVDPNTGVVTGVGVGTINISYILPTGCYAITSINVNPFDTISGPTHLCAGQTITLNNPNGGTWVSSNTAVATIDSVSGVLTGISTGVVTVTYTAAFGCSATYTVTVDASPAAIIPSPDSVCQGQSITLTNAVAGGTWISNNIAIATVGTTTATTAIITGVLYPGGITVGTDVITYLLASSGCQVTTTVTVNPIPTAITGLSDVCQRSTITLTESTTLPGTWSSSNNAAATVGPTTGNNTTVYGVATGSTIVSYTLPTGCFAAHPVNVHPIDSTRGTDTVVCAGKSVQLTNTTPGTGGVWVSNNPSVATVDNTGLVSSSLTSSGGYVTITYKSIFGCTSDYILHINPNPAAINPSPINVCQGSIITLSDATTGGTWRSTNTAVATVVGSGPNTALLGGVLPGTDSIYYTLSTGCFITATLTVNPIAAVVPNAAPICVGKTVTLTDAIGPGTWVSTNTGVATVGANSGTVTGVAAGTDVITYHVTGSGCTATATITVNPLPSHILGIVPVCVGFTIQLSDSSGAGTWASGTTALATVDINSGVLTGVSAGTDRVTFTLDSTGCQISDTVVIKPIPHPIGGNSFVCIFGTTTLTELDSTGYFTSSNTSIATIDSFTGIVHGLDTGVVTIRYTLPNGCPASFTMTVEPLPIAGIRQSRTSVMCIGATDTLTGIGAGINGHYTWSPPTGLTQDPNTDSIVYVSPHITTIYIDTVITQYGCKSTDSIKVIVDSSLLHLAITGKDSICNGECDQLMVTGGVDSVYIWRPFTALNCTNCPNPIACPQSTTTYFVTAVDFMGCYDSTSFTVTVNPLPVLSTTPNPIYVCKGTPKAVTVNGAGDGGRYTWRPNLFVSCDTCGTVFLSDTSNAVFEVTGTTVYGCKDSISVPVSVLDTNRNTISNDTILCIGKSAQLIATSQSLTSNLDVPTYTWYPATGLDNPYIFNPTATPAVTTIYSVVIRENACFSDTEQVQVTVEPLPAIIITPPSATVVAGTSVQLLATAPNVIVSNYAWTPGATLSCDTCDNPIATPLQTTTYSVTAISSFGCIGTGSVTIQLHCDNSQIFIPNTFTPNGDGVNDRFYISGKGITTITNFQVYNRWGQEVYERHNINVNDPASGWDGTYNGIVLEPDVFIYVVTATCELGGAPFVYKGDVSIVR